MDCGTYKVVMPATVRIGKSPKAKESRTLAVGTTVTVLEIGRAEGHVRARISALEWVSILTKSGSVLLVVATNDAAAEPEAKIIHVINPVQAVDGLA